MDHAGLLKRIAELEGQIAALTAEKDKLLYALTPPEPASPPENPSSGSPVNKHSPPRQKIELFMSLFRGRTDVYAKRYYNKKLDKGLYVPACKNEWDQVLCKKPEIKCRNCKNRVLLPLTDGVIERHLRNRDESGNGIIGIYPLLPDETCRLLAVDFDEKDWTDDIAAFRTVCEELEVPVAIERSRSGNGGHAWIFFDEALPATSARKMGNILLTKAMNIRHEIRFSSYDRMFPNQDVMPSGGFGNLIALPLQGSSRQKGNSEFVDAAFKPYPDQWAYLSSIRKMSAAGVSTLLSLFRYEPELGQLAEAFDGEEEDHPKPWEPGKAEIQLKASDFPGQLVIVEANMLYVAKEGVSQYALNHIKRLAAFRNPDFYRKQKMRVSTYDTPRIIYSQHETSGYLGIPRGCRNSLTELLDKSSAGYIFEDKRTYGETAGISFRGTLLPEQQAAFNALSEYENGVLSVPTAFGKTVIGMALIARRKCKTLILVHLHTLEAQWKKAVREFLSLSKKDPAGIVDIALVQSLVANGEAEERIKGYGMVIVDECHHASSLNYEKVLSTVNARYVYGLTATPVRRDGQHPLVFMYCGAIRYTVDTKSHTQKQGFMHSVTPRFTTFGIPSTPDDSLWHITQIYASLCEDNTRNRQIILDVIKAVETGRTPVILTQRKEHAIILAVMIEQEAASGTHILTLTGSASAKARKDMTARLAGIPEDEPLVIVATGKYAGEGFDYPRLDTLFLATPVAWKGTLAQYAGRLHRNYSGKEEVRIYDYVDRHVPVLERMYRKRLAGYKQMGYKVVQEESTGQQLFPFP
ncbi:TOTE conflict system archaeo-eukaryotic primase domain-containing protein [Dysgonomonas termitidis]|uniref:DEAD/DEAH box helicase family protein n=1 Tax=Dysgonomonas termitidis TaxID=1516126 RepID=A0ABV9KRR1_9BACT